MLHFHFSIDDLSHRKLEQVNRVHLMVVYLSIPIVNNDNKTINMIRTNGSVNEILLMNLNDEVAKVKSNFDGPIV